MTSFLRRTLTAFLAIGFAVLTFLVLFIAAGHLVSGPRSNGPSGTDGYPRSGGVSGASYNETVTIPAPPLRQCASGPISSYLFHNVAFVFQSYRPCFHLIAWGINGTVAETNGTSFMFQLEEGAPPVLWLNWTSPDGKVAVDWLGTTWKAVLTVSEGTYTVTFTETGLPTGSNWSVVLGGVLRYSGSSSIEFTELNGTYTFEVRSISGYAVSPSSGTVTVAGSSPSVSVTFMLQSVPREGVFVAPRGLSADDGDSEGPRASAVR